MGTQWKILKIKIKIKIPPRPLSHPFLFFFTLVIPIGYHGEKGIKFDMFTLAKALGPVDWAWFGLARLGSGWLSTARLGSGLLPYTIIHKMEGGISKL